MIERTNWVILQGERIPGQGTARGIAGGKELRARVDSKMALELDYTLETT